MATKPKRKATASKAKKAVKQETTPISKSQKSAMAAIRTRVIKVGTPVAKAGGATKTTDENELISFGARNTIQPPYDPAVLMQLPENNTILEQCIAAMEINIDGFGQKMMRRPMSKEFVESNKLEIETERLLLNNFFRNAIQDISFTRFRRQIRRDMEVTGNGYMEMITEPTDETKLCGFGRIQPSQIRVVSDQRRKLIEYKRKELVAEIDEKGNLTWGYQSVKSFKRFHRFVQIVGTKRRYFKEFGDPRLMDYRTGFFITEDKADDFDKKFEAGSILHLKINEDRGAYGIPRYVGNMFSIYGSRAAEESNFFTFKNNNIPSMALMVSNGQLTDGSVERIQEFVTDQVQGDANYSSMLVIEAEPSFESGQDQSQVRIDIKPLKEAQHTDELFQNYDKNNRTKIRMAFRLAPLYVGDTEKLNKATGEIARRVTEEQVFEPERREYDDIMNMKVFPSLDAKFHEFRTNTPNPTDTDGQVKLMGMMERGGGLTPRMAREIGGDVLGRDLGNEFEGVDPDTPFGMQLVREAKNQAPVNASTAGAGPAASGATPAAPADGNKVEKHKSTDPEQAMIDKAGAPIWSGIIDVSGDGPVRIVKELVAVRDLIDQEMTDRFGIDNLADEDEVFDMDTGDGGGDDDDDA